MRDGPTSDVLAGACSLVPRVTSWLDGDVLAEDIPVLAGQVSWSRGSKVPDRATLTVPERADGTWWAPGTDPRAPLARYGQTLDVHVRVTGPLPGQEWDVRLTRLLVHSWRHRGGVVEVTCYGMLHQAVEARFPSPEVPRAGGTLGSELRRLVPAGMGVSIHPDLTDRACPQGMTWETERIDAIYEIADAWPALLGVDGFGQLALSPPVEDMTPVVTWSDGDRGVVVDVQDEDTRDGAYNAVIATSTQDDATSAPVRAVATQGTGPMAWTEDGTGYGQVPRFFSSPLLGSQSAAVAAARSMLAQSVRPSRMVQVTLPPDPRVELDDVVRVVQTAQGGRPKRSWVGLVHTVDLPLVTGSGPMTVAVAVG